MSINSDPNSTRAPRTFRHLHTGQGKAARHGQKEETGQVLDNKETGRYKGREKGGGEGMRVLELYAGSRSVGKVAEEMGYEVFSVDIEPFEGIDLVKDVEMIERSDIPFIPDIIWASPPCTTYSLAAVSTHRNGPEPKTEDAERSDRLREKTLEIFSWFPEAKFYMENPVAMMGKMPQTQRMERVIVTYCSYDHIAMKPTHIFTNNLRSIFNPNGWQPKPRCKNGDTCHEAAPRSSRTGTQGLANAYERGRIPPELVKEILTAVL